MASLSIPHRMKPIRPPGRFTAIIANLTPRLCGVFLACACGCDKPKADDSEKNTKKSDDTVRVEHSVPEAASVGEESRGSDSQEPDIEENAGGPVAPQPDDTASESLKRQKRKSAPPPPRRSGDGPFKGTLSKEVIRRGVHRHINEVKFCYERILAKGQNVRNINGFQFVVNTDGTVSDVTLIAHPGQGTPPMDQCIVNAISRWTFPPPRGGRVKVTYPISSHSPE